MAANNPEHDKESIYPFTGKVISLEKIPSPNGAFSYPLALINPISQDMLKLELESDCEKVQKYGISVYDQIKIAKRTNQSVTIYQEGSSLKAKANLNLVTSKDRGETWVNAKDFRNGEFSVKGRIQINEDIVTLTPLNKKTSFSFLLQQLEYGNTNPDRNKKNAAKTLKKATAKNDLATIYLGNGKFVIARDISHQTKSTQTDDLKTQTNNHGTQTDNTFTGVAFSFDPTTYCIGIREKSDESKELWLNMDSKEVA